MSTYQLTFKKTMHFKNKHISFSNLCPFDSGYVWKHYVFKNKHFCLSNKKPVLRVLKNCGWKIYYYCCKGYPSDIKCLLSVLATSFGGIFDMFNEEMSCYAIFFSKDLHQNIKNLGKSWVLFLEYFKKDESRKKCFIH